MNSISKNKVMALLFIICLGLIATISDYKVANFYINGITDYNEWNASTDTKFETDYISNLWMKYQYVNLNGAVRNLLGQREMNGVVKLNNGYLTQINTQVDSESIDLYADETLLFQKRLEDKGIDYVWFTLPYGTDKYDSQMPMGVEHDYGNDNLDQLTAVFSKRGINIVDMREILHDEGKETYDIFYITDHHWTTRGGFWAYKQMVNYIEEKYGIEVDDKIQNIDNYSVTTYKQWHLGSRGQRTGKYFAGIDDFDLILPKFDTYIQRYGTEDGGTIQDMMINMTPLEKSDYMSRYTYDFVMGETQGYWHNPDASANLKIMVIGDSMSKAIFPYLAMSFTDVAFGSECRDVTEVDSDLIDSYQPDIIISLNYVTAMNPEAFSWGMLKE